MSMLKIRSTRTSSLVMYHLCIQPIAFDVSKATNQSLHSLHFDEVLQILFSKGMKFLKTVIFRLIKTIKIYSLKENADKRSIGQNYGIYQPHISSVIVVLQQIGWKIDVFTRHLCSRFLLVTFVDK